MAIGATFELSDMTTQEQIRNLRQDVRHYHMAHIQASTQEEREHWEQKASEAMSALLALAEAEKAQIGA